MSETLIQLRERALVCTACDLSVRRTKVVFGEGDPLSPLVLVGEGPGDQEDKSGRPFVGRAGQMLDRALVDAGISRERVYICNTVKCRSCDWNGDRPTNRPPTPEETNTCRQWLIPQLAALAPKVILCIGAPSAKNLIKPNLKITVERGLFFPCEYARTAIATLHPAYIMRRSTQTDDGGYSLLVADIKKGWDAAVRLTAGSA
ncbi:MAG: uracil-DNA glycosylase [Armatimonadetes bacterium]|nr:uracil-DNA glycosylase [Armatimonadota bacterium]